MGKAVLNGSNPYMPVNELVTRWVGEASQYNKIKHPSLHPPVVAVLSAPLGWLSYGQASFVWLLFEVVCLLLTLCLLLRWVGQPLRPLLIVALLLVALGFHAVEAELWYGQLNALMLLLLTGSWLALRAGRAWCSGVWLGAAIALKWIAWPLVLFLLLQRRWKCVAASAGVVIAANLLALFFLGPAAIQTYYLKIIPIGAYVRTFEFNLSASALGLHLFSEMGWDHKLVPLYNSPTLAWVSSTLITVGVLALGLRAAFQISSLDTAFGLLTGLSVLLSPAVWSHYLLLAAPALTVTVSKLAARQFPLAQTMGLVLLMLQLLTPASALHWQWISAGIIGKTADGIPIIAFWPSLLFLLPTVSLIGLLWLLWRLDRTKPALAATEPTGFGTLFRFNGDSE